MVGADYHRASDCPTPHFIRPVLYVFYELALPKMKAFVKENLGVKVWEDGIDAYVTWLTKVLGKDVPNHIKLYWWISAYWGQLD